MSDAREDFQEATRAAVRPERGFVWTCPDPECGKMFAFTHERDAALERHYHEELGIHDRHYGDGDDE